MQQDKTAQAFVFRLDHRLAMCLKKGVIAIGWANADDLMVDTDWDNFKQRLLNHYPDYEDAARALGAAAGSLWRFLFDMKPGDYALVPVPGSFHVARIAGEARYEQEWVDADMAWHRRVEWLTKKPVPRTFADDPLRRRLKARQTCVFATESIQQALERTAPIDLRDELLRMTRAEVAETLRTAINDEGLEDLVVSLIGASGARATRLGKRQAWDGDVDVLAVYDLKIPDVEGQVKVGFQVKKYEGIADALAVQQLIGPLEQAEIHMGCVVTTASGFSDEAVNLADKHDIALVAGDALVEWLLNVGLEKLSKTQMEEDSRC